MIFTVDRIEGDVVVLEDENGDVVTISVDILPACKAGDVLKETDGVYTVEREETKKRREVVYALEQKLRQKLYK